jgi:hypothetical protein
MGSNRTIGDTLGAGCNSRGSSQEHCRCSQTNILWATAGGWLRKLGYWADSSRKDQGLGGQESCLRGRWTVGDA